MRAVDGMFTLFAHNGSGAVRGVRAGEQEDRGIVRKAAFIVPALVLLAGCTTPMFTMPPGPVDYRVGFREGCDAGYAYAGSPFYAASDQTAPERQDQPYLTGWQEGFERCMKSQQRMQAAVSSFLGPP
ncbi:MAG: hypothetical protein ACE5DS_02480 [Kiloniellaceae bacterium]